jgi:glyoxylase I family protein
VLSRRELVYGLTALAASATGAAAQQDNIDFKSANIDHISIQVADLQRSVDFYQKMFGFSVVSQDQPLGIVRLGMTRTLVSLNRQSPAGIVDHFSIGVPRFTKEAAARYLTERGATPLDDPYAGLHVKDPDGVNVQISNQR